VKRATGPGQIKPKTIKLVFVAFLLVHVVIIVGVRE
jgi:hypothetical protein